MSKLDQQLEETSGLKDPLLAEVQTVGLNPMEKMKAELRMKMLQRIEEEKREQAASADFAKRALAANIENPDRFARAKIDYFSAAGLIPQRMQVSGRYIAILFEVSGEKQEYHVIHRYSHDLIFRANLNTKVKNLYLYDPFDCACYHSNQSSTGYVLCLLNKQNENSDQYFTMTKIQTNPTTQEIAQPSESGQWATFAAVSSDLKYAAIALLGECQAADYGGNGNYCKNRIQFIKISSSGTMSLLSVTQGADALNPEWIDSSVVFLQNCPRALITYPQNYISLTNVETGHDLYKIPLSSVGLRYDLVYFSDVDSYNLVSFDNSSTHSIIIEDDKIKLQKEKSIAYFDSKNSAGLCTSENPYKFSMKSLNGSYSQSQTTGFIINQKFFNLNMNDIKFSRVQILPGVKVFYSIMNSPPYTCNVLDLSNLDILFQASVLDNPDAMISSYSTGKQTSVIIDDKSFKKTLVSNNIKNIYSLSNFFKKYLPKVSASGCSYFNVQKNYLIVKVKTNIDIYNLETQEKIFSQFGIRANFSDDQQSIILNKGAYFFQIWTLQDGKFKLQTPFLKNTTTKVEFIPGSSTKVALFDERIKALLSYDIIKGEYEFIINHAEFKSADYGFINESLLYYNVISPSGEKKTFLYEYIHGFLETSKGLKGNIHLVQESLNKKFLYATSDDHITVFDKNELGKVVQIYPITQVYRITEFESSSILLCKTQNSVKILEVATLELDKKLGQETSSAFLMRYIFDVLENKESGVSDMEFAIDVYSMFMQNGFVDTYFDEQGTTLLHSLIKNQSVEIFGKLFIQIAGPSAYIRNFEGLSPLNYAVELSKMQHVKILVEYFAKNPNELTINHEDFICLLQLSLPEAKTIIFNQFQQPTTYKSFLPFQVQIQDELYIKTVETHNLGKKQCDEVSHEINVGHDESQLYSYSMSKFKYNFNRGSQASLNFLKAYSEEDDEQVLRSKLRLIVNKKFKESMPFLMTIAGIFYVFLILFLYCILERDLHFMHTATLTVLNTFFFMLECRQMFKDGFVDYFSDFWNYIDISVFLMNYFLFFYTGEMNGIIQFMQSVATFLMLLRGMSYLRIFEPLRYLINMVVEIIKDMSSFTLLLIYWIVGYAFIFFIFIDLTDVMYKDENAFVVTLKEIYRLAYGDFDPTDYAAAQWVAFVIATFFLPLVMLNMVIALMGDTFGRVKEASACVDMKEKAKMVLEVESFVNWRLPSISDEEEIAQRKFVLLGYNADVAENDIQLEVESKSEKMISKVFKSVKKLQSSVKKIESFKADIITEIKAIKKEDD